MRMCTLLLILVKWQNLVSFSEETFQREIMCGLLNAQEGDYLLWNIERTITRIYIPVLLDSCMGDKGTKDLLTKVHFSGKTVFTRDHEVV